jgi:hypothetical protein
MSLENYHYSKPLSHKDDSAREIILKATNQILLAQDNWNFALKDAKLLIYLVTQQVSILLALLGRLPTKPHLCGRDSLSFHCLWFPCWHRFTNIHCCRGARWSRTLGVEWDHHNVIVTVAGQVLQHHLVGLLCTIANASANSLTFTAWKQATKVPGSQGVGDTI